WHGLAPPGLMLDPKTGQPCQTLDGKVQEAMAAGKNVFEVAFGVEEGFTGFGKLLGAGFEGLSALNVVANATDCVTGTGYGSVASCGKALAGLAILANPEFEL